MQLTRSLAIALIWLATLVAAPASAQNAAAVLASLATPSATAQAPAPAPAAATDPGARHSLEIDVGGGMTLLSDAPEELDLAPGGAITGRLMVDLTYLRADARYVMFDPTRPEQLQVRGDARLLFVTVHDFTWRRSNAGELLRVLGGVGGEFDLPEGIGHLMVDAGAAVIRLGGYDNVERPLTELYGAYVGLTARLSFWEIRDEVRVAVHAVAPPDGFSLDLDTTFANLLPGATVSNRLYVQVLREGVISLGPELDVQVEVLGTGQPLVVATAGLSGSLGL